MQNAHQTVGLWPGRTLLLSAAAAAIPGVGVAPATPARLPHRATSCAEGSAACEEDAAGVEDPDCSPVRPTVQPRVVRNTLESFARLLRSPLPDLTSSGRLRDPVMGRGPGEPSTSHFARNRPPSPRRKGRHGSWMLLPHQRLFSAL